MTMMTFFHLPRILVHHPAMLTVGAMVVLGLGAMLSLVTEFGTVNARLKDLSNVALSSIAPPEMRSNVINTRLRVNKSLDYPGPAPDLQEEGDQEEGDAELANFRDQFARLANSEIETRHARHLSVAQKAVEGSVHNIFTLAVALSVAMLAFGLLTARRLIHAVNVPLRRLTEGTQILGAGNLAHRVEYAHDDEFGELVRGFNRMSGQLQQSLTELRKSSERQGQQIDEGTRELVVQASHDALTGLANRARLQVFMNDAIKGADRRGEKLALLLLDLDGFKDINDSLGHDQGDRLLCEIAERLRGQVREGDLTARIGGDEFCLLLLDDAGILRASEVAQRCLDALNAPVHLSGTTARPRASIGIALYPDHAETAADLLKAADTAMYAAKGAGKHRYVVYETDMTDKAEQQLELESALREAVEWGEFELHYQPQIELGKGRMSGVEALIRWRRPEHGLVPPDEFIPVAERIGLIDMIGAWVLETACRQAVAWQKEGVGALVMAVNISPGHFGSPGFVDTVAQTLLETGMAPACLEIEVTESVTRDSLRHASISDALRRLGVRVAIDDFGTGYSSLAVLKKMPIDTLKLDRAFICDMLEDSASTVLIGTLIGMARSLNLSTVAEGVETLEQVQVLSGLGCPMAQGYYFSRPVTANLIPNLAGTNFLKPFVNEPLAKASK